MNSLLNLLVFLVLSIPAISLGQITLSNTIIEFLPDEKPFKDIGVVNNSNTAIYVVSKLTVLKNPGEKEEDRVPSDEILVSPKRFSVPANGRRVSRLVLKNVPEDTEKVYRLAYSPTDANPEETPETADPTRKQGLLVTVRTTVGGLIFVYPRKGEARFRWERNGRFVTFFNDGNIHLRVMSLFSCVDPQKQETCTKLKGKRLYGGMSHRLEVSPELSLRFTKALKETESIETIVIPVGDKI